MHAQHRLHSNWKFLQKFHMVGYYHRKICLSIRQFVRAICKNYCPFWLSHKRKRILERHLISYNPSARLIFCSVITTNWCVVGLSVGKKENIIRMSMAWHLKYRINWHLSKAYHRRNCHRSWLKHFDQKRFLLQNKNNKATF